MSNLIHVKFPDDKGIKGEVVTEGYKDQFEATSFQFGVGRGVSYSGGKIEATAPSFSEITLTGRFDSATNDLIKAASDQALGEVVITFLVVAGQNKPQPFLIYTLKDVYITGVSVSSGGDMPSISISMAYLEIKSQYKKLDKDYKFLSDHEFTYNLATKVLA